MPVYALPEQLQQEFEQAAQSLYDEDGATRALIEAVELWLSQNRKRLIQAEATVNNQAFEALEAELIQKYPGKWIAIADGKVQGIADLPEDLNTVAEAAHHRIIVQIGQPRPKEVELGWQMTFA